MITTQAVGNLFVVVDPDGELETVVAGQTVLNWVQIHTLLRSSFGDHYDFMSCYLDTGSGVLDLGTASSTIYRDATGIGRHLFNFRSDWDVTAAHLRVLLNMKGHGWAAARDGSRSAAQARRGMLKEWPKQ